jgi:threonine dehydratase
MLHIDDIRDAARYLHGRVRRTPIITSRTLDRMSGATLFLKSENLQRTGSFKVRGALNRIRTLTAGERARGLIAISAGNHAQAVAFAAADAGVRATVVMPAGATPSKVAASRAYGADVVLHGDIFGAFAKMEELRARDGLVLAHPFDDPAVIAGQGTVGLELCDDVADLDTVIVPTGGGGLLAGVATAARTVQPRARIIGVEPTGAPAVTRGLAAGGPVRIERVDTIADGLGAPMSGPNVLELIRAHVDDIVLVTDDDIARALLLILERCKLLVEPAGAAGLAAVLAGTVRVQHGARTGIILSGGNIDMTLLQQLLHRYSSNPETTS